MKCNQCRFYEHRLILTGFDDLIDDSKICHQRREINEDGCELFEFSGVYVQ